jgi:nicotinamidase-related amidase
MLLICDIQDKFSPLIYRGDTVINRAALLNDACKVLNIPVVVTEHYPKTFGKTVSELVLREDITQVFEKRRFSMLTDDVWPMLKGQRNARGRKQFILAGVEVSERAFSYGTPLYAPSRPRLHLYVNLCG